MAMFFDPFRELDRVASSMLDQRQSPRLMPMDLFRDGDHYVLTADLPAPPYAFVQVQGVAEISTDPDELLRTATALGGRYMGADRAEEFGRRNGVPGELVVRIRPTKVVAHLDMTA